MHIIIPARYASTRLPGKPLADVGGKPLIQHVYERARETGAARICIATDDVRIARSAESFGAEVCMTRADHPSGTDRLAETIDKLGIGENEIVVNLQGDEPLMPADLVLQVAQLLHTHADASMATACHAITEQAEFVNPNVVKLVFDAQGYALYFSRAPIPWPRGVEGAAPGANWRGYRHIGLYAYRAGFVRRYAAWPSCVPEQLEQLEQLRALWHGARIAVCEARAMPGPGVDTPQDLERVRALLSSPPMPG